MHIEPLPRLTVRLLSLTAPLRRCFVLYTFSKGADNLPIRTDKMCPNHSYCAACHCSTTRDMYTATYRTVCYGWRVGIVKSIVIVTATAAPDCDLTYLTRRVSEPSRSGRETEQPCNRATSNRATEQPSGGWRSVDGSRWAADGGRKSSLVARRSARNREIPLCLLTYLLTLLKLLQTTTVLYYITLD